MPHEPGPHWGEVGIHGLHRQREWDAVASVPELPGDGDEAWFVVLADGRVLDEREADIAAPGLVDALRLPPPYRVHAVRGSSGWMAAARRIETVELPELPSGEDLEIVWDGRERTVRIDGRPTLSGVPELERLGALRHATYVVTAARVAGTTWELTVTPL